jgi:hypothetical protein
MTMQDAAKAAAAAAAARRSRDGGGSGDEDDESKAVAAKAAPAATTAVGEGSVVGAFGGIKMAAAEWWRSSKPFRHGSQSKWHLLFGEHLAAQVSRIMVRYEERTKDFISEFERTTRMVFFSSSN